MMFSSTRSALTTLRLAKAAGSTRTCRASIVTTACRCQSQLMAGISHSRPSSALIMGTSTSTSSVSVSVNPQQHQLYQQQQSRSIFIQTEETPNPGSVKFVPSGMVVLEDGDVNGFYVTRTEPKETILRSPLAKELFTIDGVKAVYLGPDFVTVTKTAEKDWRLLNPQILNILMNFFDQGIPALRDQPEVIDTTILDDDSDEVAMIKELIETRIRPAVQEDGGDILYKGFDEETGLVTVELAGSCVGCPSSSVTLKQGVENMLMHYIPEVTAVVALEVEPDEDEGEGDTETVEQPPDKQKTYEERLKAAGIPFSD